LKKSGNVYSKSRRNPAYTVLRNSGRVLMRTSDSLLRKHVTEQRWCQAEWEQMDILVTQTSNDCIQSLWSRLHWLVDQFALQSFLLYGQYAKYVMSSSDTVDLESSLVLSGEQLMPIISIFFNKDIKIAIHKLSFFVLSKKNCNRWCALQFPRVFHHNKVLRGADVYLKDSERKPTKKSNASPFQLACMQIRY